MYHLVIVSVLCSKIAISYGQSHQPASCAVPTASADKTSIISDVNGQPVANAKAGSRVPKGSTIDFQCAKGFLFADGSDSSTSFCRPNSKGEWYPAIKPCLRFCPPLQTSNVELTCKYNGRDIDCEGALLSGIVVTPRCKDLHHVSPEFNPDYTTIRCRNDGSWSRRLFKCDPDCGVPKHQPLIMGGADATLGQFPWHVAIYSIPQNYLLICGGTLVTSNVVLSAAHCFYDEARGLRLTTPTDYVIAVGKMTRNHTKIDNEVQKIIEISEILFYDKPYNPKVNGYTADIAMVILKEHATINTFVLPACFRSHNKRLGFDPGNATGVLAGWGIDTDGVPSEKLKMVQLPFIRYSECVQKLSGVTHDKFCAGADGGPRPHLGDSGGGLVFKDPNNLFYYLRGIVSTTERYSELAITMFTDISYYQEWIDRIIQEKLEDEKKEQPWTILETQTTKPDVSQCCLRKTADETARGKGIAKRQATFTKTRTAPSLFRIHGQEVVLTGMANLMLKLTRIVSKCFTEDGNVLFAPFNIAKSLSVIMLGTGGSTELEMANAIGPGLINRRLNRELYDYHIGMGRLLRNILAKPPGPAVSRDMSVASGVFLDDNYPSKETYKNNAKKLYSTEVYPMNFSGDGHGSANFMNQWIRKKTFGGIKDDVIKPPVPSTTKLMFVIAVYFNGEWEHPFQKQHTKWQTFYLYAEGKRETEEDSVQVEMMTNRAKILSYANEQLGFRAIGIPFRGGNVIMYVILPELQSSLEELSCLLGPEEVEAVIREAQPANVIYTIPKMKLHYKTDLRYALEQLNSTSLFDPRAANFSNLVEVDDVHLSDIVVATYVEVNETMAANWTTAAAPVTMSPGDIDFRVNRPFIIFMYNINVGITTFWSSVKKPTPFRKL